MRRPLLVGLAVAAAALVLVIGFRLRRESPPAPEVRVQPTRAMPRREAPRRPADAAAPAEGPAAGELGARVQARLRQMRAEYEARRRETGSAPRADQPAPRAPTTPAGRPVPEMLRERVPGAAPGAEDAPDPENDAEEVARLRDSMLHHPDPEERMSAIFFLSSHEPELAVPPLLEALHDVEAEVRLAAIEALDDFVENLQPAMLAPALDDPDAEVRFEAVGVLGEMESPEALSVVRTALRDPDEDVRELAEGILEVAEPETEQEEEEE